MTDRNDRREDASLTTSRVEEMLAEAGRAFHASEYLGGFGPGYPDRLRTRPAGAQAEEERPGGRMGGLPEAATGAKSQHPWRSGVRRLREDLDQRHAAAERILAMSVDGSYTNATVLKNLPPRTTLIGRVRKDAKLCAPPRPEDQQPRGTKRQYGEPLPTPEQIRQDESIPWQEVQAYASGKRHTFQVKTVGPVLWSKAGAKQPLRLVVIAPVGYRLRKGSKLCPGNRRI